MTQYKYQTDPTKMLEGELGVVGGQLVTKDGSGATVVVGNPANSTAVADLTPTYAEDAMDISSVRTLGSGFIFLSGTSFDAMGVGNYEFEEANGTVYGLYGRTDGISQQVYFSGAASNQEALQYTTVPYVPSFLSSSSWQAAAVCGSDLQGFTLVLRDTTPGSTASLRYIYVRHNGSLITTSGHTYVEITPVVNSYLSAAGTSVPGLIPKIVRVGNFFFIALSSWQDGAVWLAGWNAQDGSFPFINTALPSSPITYNPTTFTITTSGWPTSDITTPQTFPIVLGTQAPGGINNFRIYNSSNGAVTTPAVMNYPLPLPAGWATNMCVRLEAEDNGSGTPLLALGCQFNMQDSAGLGASGELTYTILVSFSAGGSGSYTSAVLNYIGPASIGADSFHCQPAPFYVSTASAAPNEAVASNPASPATCINKLPITSYYSGFGKYSVRSPFTFWYYSGYLSAGGVGSADIVRGIAKAGTQLGSLAAAQTNKRNMLYPMYNVSPRADFSTTGQSMANSFVQPSGKIANTYYGHMIAQDTLLTTSLNAQLQLQWTVSKFPTGSQISDTTYNRFGTSVPGFRGRTAEYLTNLPNPNSTLSTWGCVWPTGAADLNAPINFNFPVMSTAGGYSANGAACRVGSWTLSGSTYQAPPVTWNYAANMDSQLSALRTAVIAAAQAAYPNTGVSGSLYAIDVVPVMNSAGNGIVFAYGILHSSHNNGTNIEIQSTVFTTPCAVSGSTINLTNTSSVTVLTQITTPTAGVNGTYGTNDALGGRLFVVYGATAGADWYLAWSNPNIISVVGDGITTPTFARFNSSNALVSIGGLQRSQSRSMLTCSAQHQGLAIAPYRDSITIPEPDLPISRYATTNIAAQGDFAASFNAAISNPGNLTTGSAPYASNNLAELMTLQAINNNFLLQIGAISGRLNHKAYSLPSSFIDMTSFAVGTYYLYLTDTGSGGVQVQVDAAQRAESATNTYFGKFDRTSSGFANESSISEMIRFGTARLVSGSNGSAMQGSQIRIGPYVG